jgi:hypothetical protein
MVTFCFVYVHISGPTRTRELPDCIFQLNVPLASATTTIPYTTRNKQTLPMGVQGFVRTLEFEPIELPQLNSGFVGARGVSVSSTDA